MSRHRGTHSTDGDGWTPLDEVISKNIFKAEVHAWAKRVGVEVKALYIRRMTRKWGSCSTAGGLTFNSELLGESAELRKKVIVHELLHLKVLNHGKVLRAYLSSDNTTRVQITTPSNRETRRSC